MVQIWCENPEIMQLWATCKLYHVLHVIHA
jgi:hypothetical protein